jgi:hypothetical protein
VWREIIRQLSLLIGGVAASFLQLAAAVGLGAAWAGSNDVMQGDCGWDGTCSDAGTMTAIMWGILLLVAADVLIGMALARRVVRSGRWGHRTRPVGLLRANRAEIAVIIGCAAAWAVGAQAGLIGHIGDDRYPGTAGWQPAARFFVVWNVRVIAAEIAIVLLAWLTIGVRRRTRARWQRPVSTGSAVES